MLKLEPRYNTILFKPTQKARNHHLVSVNSEEETEVVPTQTQEVEEQVEDQKDGDHETKKEPEIKRVYTKEEADEIERVNINIHFHQMRNVTYFRTSNLFNFLTELQELSNAF